MSGPTTREQSAILGYCFAGRFPFPCLEVLGQSVLGGGLQHPPKQTIGAGSATNSQALHYCPVWLPDDQRPTALKD